MLFEASNLPRLIKNMPALPEQFRRAVVTKKAGVGGIHVCKLFGLVQNRHAFERGLHGKRVALDGFLAMRLAVCGGSQAGGKANNRNTQQGKTEKMAFRSELRDLQKHNERREGKNGICDHELAKGLRARRRRGLRCGPRLPVRGPQSAGEKRESPGQIKECTRWRRLDALYVVRQRRTHSVKQQIEAQAGVEPSNAQGSRPQCLDEREREESDVFSHFNPEFSNERRALVKVPGGHGMETDKDQKKDDRNLNENEKRFRGERRRNPFLGPKKHTSKGHALQSAQETHHDDSRLI